MDNDTDEDVLHSINPALVEMVANLRRKISEIVIPYANNKLARINFIFQARHFKASYEMISDLWCIGIKIFKQFFVPLPKDESGRSYYR